MAPKDMHPTSGTFQLQSDRSALYISVELSHSTWLVTALVPGSDRMSKYVTPGGNGASLIELVNRLRMKNGSPGPVVAIQEAGLDGFWVHRLLEANGIESYVVDAASIAVPRRRRRAKTDAIDGETLLRALLAWRRGEPRVCAMVVPPTREQEDRRRTSRERAALMRERVRHVNRVKGLLAGQGITDYEPLRKNRRASLETLRTGDGHPLPGRLKAELSRELDVIELLLKQIDEVSAEREIAAEPDAAKASLLPLFSRGSRASARRSPRCSGSKVSTDNSTTAVKLPPTPGWSRRHGAAARSIGSKVSRKPETGGCVTS